MSFFFKNWFWDRLWAKPEVEIRKTHDLGFGLALNYDSGAGEGGSEVVSHFDSKLYITNGASDRIDVVDALTGALDMSIDLSGLPGYDGVQSVAAGAAGVFVAVDTTGTSGIVAKYGLDGTFQGSVTVGSLPDMLTYSADGTQVFVANEGEPGSGGDPKGSISIVDAAGLTATTYDFSQFDTEVQSLREAGVRIFPGTQPSVDFEPEYIAEAGGKLFVTLQENAAVAIFDLASESWDKIVPLGTIDHSLTGLDASDRDDAINIQTYQNLVGLRMADAIAATEIDSQAYFLTANEGDDRGDAFVFEDGAYEGDDRGDAARVGDILDGQSSGNFVQFRDGAITMDIKIDASVDTTGLERLNVSVLDGDTDGDGDIDVLHAYGSRSFTIYDADGNLVFDSGEDFEQIIAANRVPNAFNNDDFGLEPDPDPNKIDENRSDNKGPEPEAIEIGVVEGKTLAFIGLERDSGIMIYDISDPANSSFVQYIDGNAFGNVSPEVIDFISAEDSTTGVAQIAVSYEVSGSTAVYDLAFGAEFKGTRKRDEIEGTLGNDEINARGGRDYVDGNGGDDLIRGGQGRDTLFGGAGDDDIAGGRGRDVIDGGMDNDILTGGGGRDSFVFGLNDGNDTITDLSRRDSIDLSATGLIFGDLTITQTATRSFTVDYGSMGDSIAVNLVGAGFNTLGEDSFLF